MLPAGAEPPESPDSRVLGTPSDLPARVLVVGLGSPDRGDDAAGAEVAAAAARTVAERGLLGIHVVEHEDPTALVDLLDPTGRPYGWDLVVVVDAIRSGAAPGSVTVLDVGSDGQDFASMGARLDPGPAGTHGFGLAGTIELARALGRLPPRVVVVGIEAVSFEHGAPLSPAVHSAIPRAAETVLGLVEEAMASPSRPGVAG
ncbi:MAG TPA: hydrogenase maturation protease [Motilibacterales bacterium]|nr:hydrogenase maturation protease [Motilibacterales bacterium]